MSANNRKIDVNDDPENDPKLAAMLGSQPKKARLQNLLQQVARDNPMSEPDKPLPPAEELKRAAMEMAQKEPDVSKFMARAEAATTSSTALPGTSVAQHSEPPALRHADIPEVSAVEKEVIKDTVSISLAEREQPQGRGRPRMGDVRKTETSYSLSPETVRRIRDLAAYNQLRLGRSVSGSEIAEYLLQQAFETIKDNEVLPQ